MPIHHSITSSARNRIDGGTARPSVLAVVRLRVTRPADSVNDLGKVANVGGGWSLDTTRSASILSIDRKEGADEQHSGDCPNGSTRHGFSRR